jgi:hypothetical protein
MLGTCLDRCGDPVNSRRRLGDHVVVKLNDRRRTMQSGGDARGVTHRSPFVVSECAPFGTQIRAGLCVVTAVEFRE